MRGHEQRHHRGAVSRNTVLAAYLLLGIAALCWSGNTIVVRAVHAEIPPFGLAFWRSILTILVLFPFFLPRWRQQLPILRGHWKLVIVLGLTQFVGGQAFMFLALQTTTAVNAGLLNATEPIMTVLVAWLLIGERFNRWQGLGIMMALTGVVIIVLRGDLERLLVLRFVPGDLWIQLSMLNWAVYAVLLKKWAPAGLHPFVLLFAMPIPACVTLLPLYVAEMTFTGRMIDLSWGTAAVVAYLTLFGTVIGVVFSNVGIARIGPSRAASFNYLIPVFTAVLAVVLLGERFQNYHFGAIVLVFSGVWLANRAHRRKPAV